MSRVQGKVALVSGGAEGNSPPNWASGLRPVSSTCVI
jgi:hypothetical protein